MGPWCGDGDVVPVTENPIPTADGTITEHS